jgi:hypothetical protein
VEWKGSGPEWVPLRYEGLAGSLTAVPRFPMGLPRCQGLVPSEWTSPQGEAAGVGDKGFLALTGCPYFGDKAFGESRGCWESRSLRFLLHSRVGWLKELWAMIGTAVCAPGPGGECDGVKNGCWGCRGHPRCCSRFQSRIRRLWRLYGYSGAGESGLEAKERCRRVLGVWKCAGSVRVGPGGAEGF